MERATSEVHPFAIADARRSNPENSWLSKVSTDSRLIAVVIGGTDGGALPRRPRADVLALINRRSTVGSVRQVPPSRLAEGVARGRTASNARLPLETRTIRRAVPMARPAVRMTPAIPRPFVFAVSMLLAPHRALVRPRVTHPMSTLDVRLAVRPQREALALGSAVVLLTDHSGANRKRVRTIPRPNAPSQSTIRLAAVQSPHVSFITLFTFVDDPVAARLGRAGARAGVAHVGARRVGRDGRGAAPLRLRVDAEALCVREPRLVVVAVGPTALRAVRTVSVQKG